jgi:hypothetical protein
MRNHRRLSLIVGLLAAAPVVAAAPTEKAPPKRDVCVASPTGGGSYNTFIIRDVQPLSAGRAIPLQGLFFTGAMKVAPFHGSAVMNMAGSVRIGLFVHSTAESINDFTVAGVTDQDFVGTWNYDNDGDFKPNGTLQMELKDCADITIP